MGITPFHGYHPWSELLLLVLILWCPIPSPSCTSTPGKPGKATAGGLSPPSVPPSTGTAPEQRRPFASFTLFPLSGFISPFGGCFNKKQAQHSRRGEHVKNYIYFYIFVSIYNVAGTDSRTSTEDVQPPPRPGHTGAGKVLEARAGTCGWQGAGPNPTTLLIPSPESGQEQPQGHQSLFLTAGSRTHIPAHPRQTLSWESKVPGVTQLPRNARGGAGTHGRKALPGHPSPAASLPLALVLPGRG